MKLLLLQGPGTPFFGWLADFLQREGHQVKTVAFCGGDETYLRWGCRQPLEIIRCQSAQEELNDWYAHLLQKHQPDAVLLFGDCRPIHRPAIEQATARAIPCWVFEEGYLRPHWITMESKGVNGFSHLMHQREHLRQLAETLDGTTQETDPPAFGSTLSRRVAYDILYHCLNGLLFWRYPLYQTHRPYPIWQEYLHWCKRLVRMQWRKYRYHHTFDFFVQQRQDRFFLYPLQLDSDYQLRIHSPYRNQREAIDHTIASFAAYASAEDYLLFKGHPLDNGMEDFRQVVQTIADTHGVAHRVAFIEGGHLPTLLRHCKGVVLVNSTVGLSALQHGLPVHCLGTAIYAMDGLTHQGSLHSFWHYTSRPQKNLLQALRQQLLSETLVYGSYFCQVKDCFPAIMRKIHPLSAK